MTVEQFRLLNELEKVSAILQHGRLMAQNVEDDSRIFLYRLESFYVSACYSNDQLSEITCYLDVDQAIPHFRKQFISINPAEREYNLPET
jgi:hypothetical protein